uniref:PX domain-containing protein n=1 Tax=Strigamia maritima TaxID=126957 RepID=T1J845_STRMM
MAKKLGVPQKLIDDTVPLTCTIENSQNTQGHVEYVLRVERATTSSWQVIRRYNDFVSLNAALQISNVELPLPPKKIFGNMDREFVAERQIGLQNYLNAVLAHPIISSSVYVKKFLDPANYSVNYQELSLQYVSMLIRSEPEWEVVEPMPKIGWRIKKQYFLVQNVSSIKQKFLLSWSDSGPDRTLDDKSMQGVLKALTHLNHPHIQPMLFASVSDSGGFVIQHLLPGGSLRDRVYKANFRHHFLAKYANPKQATPLPLGEIRSFGRQILEALKFLSEKGFLHGHLHSGNILVDGSVCRLSDIHNGILGLRSYYRAFFVQLRRVSSIEAIDVYSFGHVLYEMAFGWPLLESTTETFSTTSPAIVSILESILTSEACKRGLPTLSDLLSNPFFQDAPLPSTVDNGRVTLKLTAQLKEALQIATGKTEEALKEQHKALRQLKRVIKANAILSLDNGRRKTKSTKQKFQSNEKDDSTPPPSPAPTSSSMVPPPPPMCKVASEPSTPTSPPPPPPPLLTPTSLPPPPPLLTPTSPVPSPVSSGRPAFLGSIEAFSKSGLRKTQTKDRSIPNV